MNGQGPVALSGLAPHLGPDLLSKALSAMREIRDGDSRRGAEPAGAAAGGAAAVAGPLRGGIGNGGDWGRSVAGPGASELAPRLEEPKRSRALSRALRAAREIWDEWARAEARPAPHRGRTCCPRRCRRRGQSGISGGARALSGMAPRLEEPERSRALSEAVSATRAIADEQALPRAPSELRRGWRSWSGRGPSPRRWRRRGQSGMSGAAARASRAAAGGAGRSQALSRRCRWHGQSSTGSGGQRRGACAAVEEPERSRALSEAVSATRKIWDKRARAER